MIAGFAEIYPQAGRRKLLEAATTYGVEGLAARPHDGHAARNASRPTDAFRRLSRLPGSGATERSRSVTIGDTHAVFVSATTYTEYGCGPSAV
ncbi:hypothetical protein [Streptomyces rugosispiralis]|uniref:Uncharacterized protein n=1 Tax=Streptomyces rugosispiralis TaxID=2967341 RepID=A0ABT1VBL3_9ACTN|nr:hypothetical protein [Streptomyces rugosispiralis]MCQ8194677.1 hypothetical protein [Streptomyces rugosispiralis]